MRHKELDPGLFLPIELLQTSLHHTGSVIKGMREMLWLEAGIILEVHCFAHGCILDRIVVVRSAEATRLMWSTGVTPPARIKAFPAHHDNGKLHHSKHGTAIFYRQAVTTSCTYRPVTVLLASL